MRSQVNALKPELHLCIGSAQKEDRGKCRKGARLEERPVQGGGAETLGLKARNKAMVVVVPLRMENVIIFVCVCVTSM